MKKSVLLILCGLLFATVTTTAAFAEGKSTDTYDDSSAKSSAETSSKTSAKTSTESSEEIVFDSELFNCFDQAESLINGGLNKNLSELIDISENLTDAERDLLYVKYQKKPGQAALLNGLVGFGLGFYLQGYPGWGTMQLAFEAGSLFVFASSVWFMKMIEDEMMSGPGAMAGIFFYFIGIIGAAGGIIGEVATRIVGTIVGTVACNSYNTDLKTGLGYNRSTGNVVMAPIINPVTQDYGLAVRVKL